MRHCLESMKDIFSFKAYAKKKTEKSNQKIQCYGNVIVMNS